MAPGNFVRAVLSAASASSARTATPTTISSVRMSMSTIRHGTRKTSATGLVVGGYGSRRMMVSSTTTPAASAGSPIGEGSSPETTTTPHTGPTTSASTSTFSRSTSHTSTSGVPPPPPLLPNFLRAYPSTTKRGTVTSVGLMDRTVRVLYRHTTYDPRIRKTYPQQTTYLVADPRNSLREGDVIDFSSGYPKSRRVRHVVERIVAPFGTPVEDRPRVLSREERERERMERWVRKWKGRLMRRSSSASGTSQSESSTSESGTETDGARGNDKDDVNVNVDVEAALMEKMEHVGRIKALVMQRRGRW